MKITPRHDMLIVKSELTSKVRSDNTGNGEVMGKHGSGLMKKKVSIC